MGHSYQCRIEGVDLSRDRRLERADHGGHRWDRVHAQVGHRGVAAPPGDGHRDLVGGGQHRPGPAAGEPDGKVGRDVQGKRPVDSVKHAFIDHYRGASGPLLPGLEHKPDPTGEPVAHI